MAAMTSGASGLTEGAKRLITSPSRFTRNFSKFQLMSEPPPAALPMSHW